MLSKQINFFIGPDELHNIETFLLKKNCLILKGEYDNPNLLVNYSILRNSENIFQFYLSKEEFKNKIFFEHIESTGQQYIDILKSYCIEFSIGGFYPYSNKEFHSYRLYYISEYYENSSLIRKDEEFLNWANHIFISIKKQFLKSEPKYSNDLFSKEFLNWIVMNSAKRSIDGTKFLI